MKSFDRVKITTDRLEARGIPRGTIGYIVEDWPDGGKEIEVSHPVTGDTIATFSVTQQEIELAP